MVIPIPSGKARFALRLAVSTDRPMGMGICVYDPLHPCSNYFKRRVPFRKEHFKGGVASRELLIPLPVSPEKLELELYDKRSGWDEGIRIDRLEKVKLPAAEVWATPARHRFMEFAIGFAQKAGYTQGGYYSSPQNEFLFQYLPTIRGEQGEELVTPARIHRQMPRVQLSQKLFRQFSIPVRVAILAHEGCHFFRNTRSETEADLCGMQYYLDYGFPTIEAVYAATRVFMQHPENIGPFHVDRTRDIIRFIDQYKAKRKLKQVV